MTNRFRAKPVPRPVRETPDAPLASVGLKRDLLVRVTRAQAGHHVPLAFG